jgi:hypothetical protein
MKINKLTEELIYPVHDDKLDHAYDVEDWHATGVDHHDEQTGDDL